jgi:hypothetical protein
MLAEKRISYLVPGADTPSMPAPKLDQVPDLSLCAPRVVNVETLNDLGEKSTTTVSIGDSFKIDQKLDDRHFIGRVVGFRCGVEKSGQVVPISALLEPSDRVGKREQFMLDTLATGGHLYTTVSRIGLVEIRK